MKCIYDTIVDVVFYVHLERKGKMEENQGMTPNVENEAPKKVSWDEKYGKKKKLDFSTILING